MGWAHGLVRGVDTQPNGQGPILAMHDHKEDPGSKYCTFWFMFFEKEALGLCILLDYRGLILRQLSLFPTWVQIPNVILVDVGYRELRLVILMLEYCST